MRTIWLAFALCLAVALAAMAWVSATALRLDRSERQAAQRAAAEEKIRLALWRMDSALVPLIVQESARPCFVYQSFHPLRSAYTRLYKQISPGEVMVASPLLTFQSPEVLLHFQVGADGEVTSPQVPAGNDRHLATESYTTGERIDRSAARLAELRKLLDRPRLLAALPPPGEPGAATQATASASPRGAGLVQGQMNLDQQAAARTFNVLRAQRDRTGQLTREQATQFLNTANAVARYSASDQAQVGQGQQLGSAAAQAAGQAATVAEAEGPLRPCWVGKALVLARRVCLGRQEQIQGCWLNWEQIRGTLLKGAADLLPEAGLAPAAPPTTAVVGTGGTGLCENASGPPAGGAPGGGEYVLASLPVRLEPGDVPQDVPAERSPVAMSLCVAWTCMLLGAAAVAVMLGKAVSLSQRRGEFVSAVTHELRTPLTTFRLYADMLAGGMVADEAKRGTYLRRLRDEADRLSHLVENVLAYARLAGPRSRAHLESVPVGDIVDRGRDRLAALAERAGMQLLIEADADALATAVRCNASAVEQVLLNLMDNACKYAGAAEDRRIHLQVTLRDRMAVLAVRDHGPGIDRAGRRRLFDPFRKSARQAAHSAPGVGLGLSISRRLARNMGGDLVHTTPAAAGGTEGNGASFELRLPVE
jgi:signal transduction histidine kinase